MDNPKYIDILASALRAKLHHSDDLVAIGTEFITSYGASLEITQSTQRMQQSAVYSLVFSTYDYTQWKENDFADLSNDIRRMLADSCGQYVYMQEMLEHEYAPGKTVLSCISRVAPDEDGILTIALAPPALLKAFDKFAAGYSFREAFQVDEIYAAAKADGLHGTGLEHLSPKEAKAEIQLMLNSLRSQFHEEFAGHAFSADIMCTTLVKNLRNRAPIKSSESVAVPFDKARGITELLPEEVEILLRLYPEPDKIAGSIIFTPNIVSDNGSHVSGESNPYKKNIVINESNFDDGRDLLDPQRLTIAHELTHFISEALAEKNPVLSSRLLDAADVESLKDEAKRTRHRLNEKGGKQKLEAKIAAALELDLNNEADRAFITRLEKQIGGSIFDMRLAEKSYKDRGYLEEEWLARGHELKILTVLELLHHNPALTRDEASVKAQEFIRLYSPTIARIVGDYENERDGYLHQLRREQGPIERVLYSSQSAPDPTLNREGATLLVITKPKMPNVGTNAGVAV